MLFSTKRIPTKYAIAILCVITVFVTGYCWTESQLNYHFIGSRKMAPLSDELKTMVREQLSIAAEEHDWPYMLQDVLVEDIIDVTNKIVASRLEYEFEVSCFDPNVAWKKQKVNCTGYAALQVAILNYIFENYNLDYRAEWHSGKVFFGDRALSGLATYLPGAYSGWHGGHCYPVVYSTKKGASDFRLFSDACFYDMFYDGWVVSKEER